MAGPANSDAEQSSPVGGPARATRAVGCTVGAVLCSSLFRFVVADEQAETRVAVFLSSTLQPKMVAHVALVDVDVLVVPLDTTETTEVVVEQTEALLVSQRLSGLDWYVGTRSLPMLLAR